jgi:hypothetical protein
MDMKRTKSISMVRNKPTAFLLCLLILSILTSCTIDLLATKRGLDPEVSKLLQTIPPTASYPDAEIITLLDEAIEEIFSDGRCNSTAHMVFQIVSERGKHYANCEIGYNSRTETISLVYARTITPEGKIIPLKKNAIKVVTPYSEFPNYSNYKQLTFSMPAVGLGCIIDYKYVIAQRGPTIKGRFVNRYFFQWYNPILTSRYKIIAPEDVDLKYLLVNPLKDIHQSPTVIRQGRKKIYLWEYRDIPQILDEDYMPPIEEVAFNILVSTMDSWEDFFGWWRQKIRGKTEPDDMIRQKAAELTRDLSSTRDKIGAIFDYVKRGIRYVSVDLGKSGYEPEAAPEVFENKYGDCKDQSTLLISMLKAAGIPSHYVLIPTHDIGNLIKDFPYPFQFDHCIVAAEEGEGYQFLDPTAEYHDFHYLPDEDQNRGVLIFKDHETIFGKTPLAESESNAYFSQQFIEIKADRAIEIVRENLSSGSKEAFLRSFYAALSPTEIKEAIEGLVSNISPGANLIEYHHADPLDFQTAFTEYAKAHVPDYCKKVGEDILMFRVPIAKACSGTDKEERRYPLVRKAHSYRRDEAVFNIPEGYEVYYLPEPVEIKNPYFEYRSSYRREGGKVFYEADFIQKAGQILPEKYTDYRTSCHLMEKSCERYVLFREKR